MYLEPRLSHRFALITEPADLLRTRVGCAVVTERDAGYDTARKPSVLVPDPRPYAIVQVETATDVAATVDFAREIGFPLAVRSGGHSLTGFGTVDDGIVVDLAQMKAVAIDSATGIGRVQAGANTGDLLAASAPLGLALTTGDTASVGLGGLTTGGGVGFMARKYGLTIDSLLSAEVVLADGRIVTASEFEHPDLFWAIRGGGGNFGIVTEFTFQLARVGTVLGGALVLPATRAVVRGYLDYSVAAPDELTTIANVMHLPPAPFVPADRVGDVALVILTVWDGDIEAGQQALEPLRALADPLVDTIQPMPYAGMYQYTAAQEMPHAAATRMMFANELSDRAIDETLAAVAASPGPMSLVQFRGMGGAIARVDRNATAFAHRQQPWFVAILGLWSGAEEEAPQRAWTADLWAKIRDESAGVYVNFLESEGDDRTRAAYPDRTYAHLAAIKQIYDPENFFRRNQNIAPRG